MSLTDALGARSLSLSTFVHRRKSMYGDFK